MISVRGLYIVHLRDTALRETMVKKL